ncbi:MAG: hypothetical protein ACRC80_35990 [Waterburya sp.]
MNNSLAKLFFTFVIVSGLLLSCGESLPPLSIPSKKNIQKIEVLDKCTARYEPLFLIKDKQKIQEIMTFLAENNHSWGEPFGGTAPTLPFKLDIYSKEKQELVIWFGNKGLMGRTGKINDGGVRLKTLSSKEMEELIALVGIKDKECYDDN